MNRAEFMSRLTALLQDVPPAEREEALTYYNEYFDDAGEGNEQSVIAALGSPEELAKSIKAGVSDGGNSGEFTESGFQSYRQESKNQIMSTDQHGSGGQGTAQGRPQKKPLSGGQIALIVLLAVLTFPIWIGVAAGLFGGAVGLLGGLFGIFVAFLAVGVVLTVVGIALVVGGIVAMFGTPLGGLTLIGGGLITTAVGLVFVWLMVLVVGTAIPALIRGIVNLCSRLFHRGGEKA